MKQEGVRLARRLPARSSHAGWIARVIARGAIPFVILGWSPRASAGFWSKVLSHDVDVITVTDMTEAGQAYPNATPANPVYYMIIDVGERPFGRTWAGEKIPGHRTALKWMMGALAEQGYRLADEQHPPTQLLVYGWGMMQGGPERPALKFLGGDKVDLMWEQDQIGGFINARVLLRNMQRVGITGKVWDLAESDLFLGIVRSFSMDSLKGPKTTLLWETRFACPALGLYLDTTMPLMIKAAAVNLGRETNKPVNLNATDAFKGHVDLGELKILGTAETEKNRPDPAPKPPDSR